MGKDFSATIANDNPLAVGNDTPVCVRRRARGQTKNKRRFVSTWRSTQPCRPVKSITDCDFLLCVLVSFGGDKVFLASRRAYLNARVIIAERSNRKLQPCIGRRCYFISCTILFYRVADCNAFVHLGDSPRLGNLFLDSSRGSEICA